MIQAVGRKVLYYNMSKENTIGRGGYATILIIMISKKGIFHLKFGVSEDHEGNLLSFSGSLNETYEGYQLNGEETKVFTGWVP